MLNSQLPSLVIEHFFAKHHQNRTNHNGSQYKIHTTFLLLEEQQVGLVRNAAYLRSD